MYVISIDSVFSRTTRYWRTSYRRSFLASTKRLHVWHYEFLWNV